MEVTVKKYKETLDGDEREWGRDAKEGIWGLPNRASKYTAQNRMDVQTSTTIDLKLHRTVEQSSIKTVIPSQERSNGMSMGISEPLDSQRLRNSSGGIPSSTHGSGGKSNGNLPKQTFYGKSYAKPRKDWHLLGTEQKLNLKSSLFELHCILQMWFYTTEQKMQTIFPISTVYYLKYHREQRHSKSTSVRYSE